MRKLVIIFLIIFLSTIIFIMVYNGTANRKILENENNNTHIINTNALTMMYETDYQSGEYQVSTDITWPQEGYTFNEVLSDYLDYYNIAIKEFSDRLNISDYELNDILNNNIGISEKLKNNISKLTNIDIKLIEFAEKQRVMYKYLSNKFNNEKEIKKYLNSLGLTRLVKEEKLKLKDSTNDVQNAIDLFEYLNIDFN